MAKRSKKQIADARARQLAGLRRGKLQPKTGPSKFELTKPKITPELAAQFVKLRSSGFTIALALRYMFPPGRYPTMTGSQQKKQWLNEWATSPLVIEAVTHFNGGKWEDLDHDRRIMLALDHLDAQMALFLYRSDYNADDAPLGKIADARSALLARIKAKDGDETPFERAMRDLLEGKITDGPPQLKGPLPVPRAQDLES